MTGALVFGAGEGRANDDPNREHPSAVPPHGGAAAPTDAATFAAQAWGNGAHRTPAPAARWPEIGADDGLPEVYLESLRQPAVRLEGDAHRLQQPERLPGPVLSEARDGDLEGAADPGRAGLVTAYGVEYNGRPLGCSGRPYSSEDASIAASPWSAGGGHWWPCGTVLRVSGPGGSAVVIIQDACPGCEAAGVVVDLSEAANLLICGGPAAHTCSGTVEVIE